METVERWQLGDSYWILLKKKGPNITEESLFVCSVEGSRTDVHITVFVRVTLETSYSPPLDFDVGLDFDQFASNSLK